MSLYADYLPKEQKDSILKILPLIRAGFRTREDDLKTWTEQDWQQISWFAQQHRVLPILWHNLKKNSLTGHMPSKIADFLGRQYLMTVSRNLRMARGLVDILAFLHDRNIPAVPYKGPVLAQAVYGDFGLRYYQDLDILLPEEQVMAACNFLREAGYQPCGTSLKQEQLKAYLRHGKEVEFITPKSNIGIDLHWKIAKHTRFPFDFDFCAPRLKQIHFNDRRIWSLSREDTVLALCLHGSSDQVWPCLEMILALAEFVVVSPDLDWDLLLELSFELGCSRALYSGLFLADDLFDLDLALEIRKEITKDPAVPRLAARVYEGLFQQGPGKNLSGSRLRQAEYHLLLRKSLWDKIHYVGSRIFLPTKNDLQAMGLDPRWFGLYFFLRPARLGLDFLRSRRS